MAQNKKQKILDNVPKVYEAGQKSEYDRFWDAYQYNGTRTSYNGAFSGIGWTETTFIPKYDINVVDAYMMFYRTTNLEGVDLVEYLGKINKKLDFSNATTLQYAFGSSTFSRIGIIDCRKVRQLHSCFNGCQYLNTIDKLIVNEETPFRSDIFQGCKALKNITIEGVLALTNAAAISFQWCPLTHDSLMSIINALKDYSTDTSGTTWLITLGSGNIAKLSNDELNMIEAKGWQYR